ncbi:MAG TPA: hypothetical protein PLJ35_05110 [Anaerolineae bacterium]|nr:hypothetical protein [Anaerolineae bacterium]
MIGHVMRECLRALAGAGWCETSTVLRRSTITGDGRMGTVRKALHSLVRRGLVEKQALNATSSWVGYYEWCITKAGEKWLREHHECPEVGP